MKIAWIVNNFPDPSNDGVSGIFFERMLNSLPEEAGVIHVIAPVPYVPALFANIPRYRKYTGIPLYEERGRLRIHRPRYLATPREHYTGLAHIFKFFSIFRLSVWRDITLIDARYAYPNGAVACLLKKWKGIPFVVSAIGTDVNVDPEISPLNNLILKRILRSADGVVAVSSALASRLLLRGAREVRVVYDGIDVSKKSSSRSPGASSVTRLVFLGEIAESKGIPLIAELIARYPQFAGPRYEWHFIGNAAQQFGLNAFPNTVFHGRMKHEDAMNMLADCDIMVYPSLGEGIPNALKEAGLLGLVVVASDAGGIPELLLNGDGGYIFRSGDTEHFCQCLTAACELHDEARQKACTLRSHILDTFDVRNCASALFSYYHEIISTSSGNNGG